MDPVQKIWIYYNWLEDQKDLGDLTKNHAYLIGSFTNPEAVKKMLNDDTSSVSLSDEEFEESLEIVKNSGISLNKNDDNKIRKRKRKILKE